MFSSRGRNDSRGQMALQHCGFGMLLKGNHSFLCIAAVMCSGDVIFHCGPITLPYNVDYVVNGSLLARPPAYFPSRFCRTPEGTASYYGRGRRERSVAPPPSSRYGRVMYPRRTLRAALPEPQACEKGRGGYPCPRSLDGLEVASEIRPPRIPSFLLCISPKALVTPGREKGGHCGPPRHQRPQ
jgi:hypothetical protein